MKRTESGGVRQRFALGGSRHLSNDFPGITATTPTVTGQTEFITQFRKRGGTAFTALTNLFVGYLTADANVHIKVLKLKVLKRCYP